MNANHPHEKWMIDTYVSPFYMKLPRQAEGLIPSLAAVGREAPLSDILELLDSHWRNRKMGAWFAVVRQEPEVLPAVLDSMRTSLGDLTAPELAVASILLGGESAIPALLDYQVAEVERDFGYCGAVTAAIESIGGRSLRGPATEDNRAFFGLYMDVALAIRAAAA
jgi:hypothetical protein